MKVVILCGGKGTRLHEYADKIPKPLVEIGGKPILWHIVKYYAHYGFNNFILCLGYKGEKIREYFNNNEEFNIEFVDTGLESNKGERIRQIRDYVKREENFFVAYGDDLSDINLNELLKYHYQNKKIVTLTAVNPISQFGILELKKDGFITKFREKPKLNHWINGGFFVFNQRIFDYIKKGWDLEKEVFEKLATEREICAFKYYGFWKTMNTFKDTLELNELWNNNKAAWKVWE